MKTLTLILATLALALTACGAPFDAREFSPSIGQAGSLDAAGGSGSAAGAIGLGHAGSAVVSEAGQGGTEDGAAGAAGEPGMPQAGSAGAPQGGSGSAGAGGGAGHAGASPGGAGGAAASGGAGGSVTPPGPPCAPAVDVSTKTMLDLGTASVCLKTTAPFDYFTCSNWDDRTIEVNGVPAPCWTGFAEPRPIDGYNYILVSAGTSQKASLGWSKL